MMSATLFQLECVVDRCRQPNDMRQGIRTWGPVALMACCSPPRRKQSFHWRAESRPLNLTATNQIKLELLKSSPLAYGKNWQTLAGMFLVSSMAVGCCAMFAVHSCLSVDSDNWAGLGAAWSGTMCCRWSGRAASAKSSRDVGSRLER